MSVIFQSNLDSIDSFTLSIRLQVDLCCEKCKAYGQFVPHGWFYKLSGDTTKHKVGKRIICDRRRGGSGCGATMRILVQNETHRLWCTTAHLLIFLTSLLAGAGIFEAYESATKTVMSRNAWRWWAKLKGIEGGVRNYLFRNDHKSTLPSSPTEISQPVSSKLADSLHSVLKNWIDTTPENLDACAQFQGEQQIPLL